jgi:hypothetical protein
MVNWSLQTTMDFLLQGAMEISAFTSIAQSVYIHGGWGCSLWLHMQTTVEREIFTPMLLLAF